MSGYTAWGKLSRSDSELRFHPLIDHMFDVAACFAALAQCASIQRALQRTAGRELDAVDLARLGALAFLHDIGKANAGFQSRRWAAPETPPEAWPTTPFGHGPEGWALVTGAIGPTAATVLSGLPLDEMSSWGGEAADALLQASISHHGRPVNDDPGKQTAVIWRAVHTRSGDVLYDPAATVAAMGTALRQGFASAFEAGGRALPDRAAFVHLFAGLVQLADWLGSDTRPGFFEYSLPGEDRCITARRRATRAVKAIGLDVDPWRRALALHQTTFEATFGVPAARPMQSALASLSLGPLTILEAETGSGKTEAALWRFAQLFQAGLVDSLYFALPTRVAASQLYERTRKLVAKLWPEDTPVVVRALPGYEAADGEAKISLPDFQVLWADKPSDSVAQRRWVAESPKRFLAATIAVGTIDQALLGALKLRHAHLRHALLSRSLLVVDEVHASDAYMTVLLEQLLKAHLHTGGQALLLSATLGAVARTRYLNAGRSAPSLAVPPLAEASKLAYPSISHLTAAGMAMDHVAGNPQHKTVHWQTLEVMEDPGRIAELALAAAAQGARVLVVRNTVPAAVKTLLAIEQGAADLGLDCLFKVDGVSTLHHSRFSRQDRPRLDQAVEAQLGKQRDQVTGRIVVGTQTLEQSLDIDADMLITDLCPMDVLLQRIGRLHRHARPAAERPSEFRQARAWILTPAGHDLTPMLKAPRNGLGRMRDGGGVYPDLRILEATRRLIDVQASRLIPGENRELVERATHPQALQEIEISLGEAWQKVGQAIEGDTGARRSLANLHVVSYDLPFSDASFPDGEEKIATRLGAADRLITFASRQPGPFGIEVTQLALRFHQVPAKLDPDTPATEITALPGGAGFEFCLATTRYRYSRLGLERLPAKQDLTPLMPGDPA